MRSEYLADSLYEFSIRFKPAWCGYGHLSRTARLVSLQMRIGNAGASSGAERHFASAELRQAQALSPKCSLANSLFVAN